MTTKKPAKGSSKDNSKGKAKKGKAKSDKKGKSDKKSKGKGDKKSKSKSDKKSKGKSDKKSKSTAKKKSPAKTASAKKSPAKKSAAKKTPAKKASAKKTPTKKPATGKAPAVVKSKPTRNNYITVIFDSCRFDSFVAGKTKMMEKLGALEKRYSYASWTAPSHYNLVTGLMPHTSPPNVYASEYYKEDFFKYSERLGLEGTSFRDLVPHLNFPTYLQKLGYHTHARVSLPVLNSRTGINRGFDTFKLMDKHNDMRAMFETMRFSESKPSYFLLNVGETHYPYALPTEDKNDWPRISGVHGVFKKLDDNIKDGKVQLSDEKFFDKVKMGELHQRQIETVTYLDRVIEELFDLVPKNTYITLTADHGELFGEAGYFGHGPINHDKVFEVPFLEGKIK